MRRIDTTEHITASRRRESVCVRERWGRKEREGNREGERSTPYLRGRDEDTDKHPHIEVNRAGHPRDDVLAVSIFFPFRQKELALLEEETTTAAAAAASPLSPRIAAAGGGASSSSHSVGGGGHRSVSALDPSCVVDVDFILIGGGMDDCLHLWSYSPHESHSTQLLQILTPSPQPSCINAVVCLDSQATGPIVIAGTANAEVIVWSLVGPRYSLLAVMTGHSDEIQSLAVHQAEGGYAFAVSGGHYLLIFCLRYIYHICIHIYMICMYRNCSIYCY